MASPLDMTPWRFDVSNASVLTPTFHPVTITDGEGNEIEEMVMTVDGDGQPVCETVSRDLCFFVQKADITEADARSAFDLYTGGLHPDAVQSIYEPTPEQWDADWNAGVGTFYELP